MPASSSTLIAQRDAIAAERVASMTKCLLRNGLSGQFEEAASLSRQLDVAHGEANRTRFLVPSRRRKTRAWIRGNLRVLMDPKTTAQERVFYAHRLLSEEVESLHLEVIGREMANLDDLLWAATSRKPLEYPLAATLPHNVREVFLAGDLVARVRVALEYAAGVRARLVALAPFLMANLGVN